MLKFTAKERSCSVENNHCCTPKPKGKKACPKCAKNAKGVLGKTLAHLLTNEARSKLGDLEGYYFCKTPSCEVVYFGDESVLKQKDVSVVVGLKEGAVPATVCYCFSWTKEKIRSQLAERGQTNVLEDIKAKMVDPGCSCEVLNPSGGCCLGDVAKAIKEIRG